TKDTQVNVFCTNIGVQGIELRVVADGIDFRDVYKIQSDLREKIISEFQKNKIELPLLTDINIR
ncbi:MAG: hypothetical protein N3A61_05865, partial [Ignavibacteria bacterium]|nr:hypothetical protein [Ignavibacteria bacterium]